MIVGQLDDQMFLRPIASKVVEKVEVAKDTHTFKLQALSGKDIYHWKHWYDDLDFCGRHFLLYSKKHPLVKR